MNQKSIIAIVVAVVLVVVAGVGVTMMGGNGGGDNTVHVTGITVSGPEEIEVGETTTLSCTVRPSNATDKSVTWESTAPAVATVDSAGKVTGVSPGTARIIVTTTDGGFAAILEIAVVAPVIIIDSPTLTEEELTEAKAIAESDPTVSLEIPAANGSIILDSKAILSLDSTVTLAVDVVDVATQPEDIREVVGSRPLFDISLGDVTSFGDGTVTVILPYTLSPGEDASAIFVYYLVSGSDPVRINATYADGNVSFTTNHFSQYAIMSDTVHTVTFAVGDDEFDTVKVKDGGYATLPSGEPVKAGLKFCSWTGYSPDTPITADVIYQAYFSEKAPYDYSSIFSYSGVFGIYAASEKVSGMPATAVSLNGYVANPENVISWYVGSDARAFYAGLVSSMSSIQSVMGAEPVELAVSGVDNVVAYKTDVSGVVSFSMVYFAALCGDAVIYAVEPSDSPDRYSGIMSVVGVIPTTADIADFLTAVLSTAVKVPAFAVGYAPDYVEEFVANYGEGAFGSYAVGEPATPYTAFAEGNGAVTWTVTADGAAIYADLVDAVASYPGAVQFNVSGYENVSIYTVSYLNITDVYFVAYSDVAVISNFTKGGPESMSSINGGTHVVDAVPKDIVTFVNFAVRTIGGSIFVLGGDLTNDVVISVNAFIEKIYAEPDENASWTIMDGSTSSEVFLQYQYFNRSGNERDVYFRITYEDDIDGAFSELSNLIASYVGQTAIMGSTAFSDYEGEIPGVTFKAVTYWGSSPGGTSAARFAVTSGNILIDGSLAPYVDPENPATAYPYMKIVGNQEEAEPQLKALITAFSMISDYGLMYDITDYASGADWFVENYAEPYASATWTVSPSSTVDEALLAFDYLTAGGSGVFKHADLRAYASDNASSEFQRICDVIDIDKGAEGGMSNLFLPFDFGFSDLTYYAIGYQTSTSLAVKFVIQSGDVIIDGSTHSYSADDRPSYFYIRAPRADQFDAVRYLFDTLIEAFTDHASTEYVLDIGAVTEDFLGVYEDSKAEMTMIESTGKTSTIEYHYKNQSGKDRTVYFYISYEDDIESAYADLSARVAALDGTTYLSTTTYALFDEEIEGVTYTAVWYKGGSMGALRFVMAVGDVLIDASFFEPEYAYPYMYLNVPTDQHDLVIDILKQFNDGFSNVFKPAKTDDKLSVTIEYSAIGGTVTGAGRYDEGAEATLTATPNAKYEFSGWYSGEELLCEDATYVFTVTEDTVVEARFTFVPGPSVTGVTISRDAMEIEAGEFVYLIATVLPDDAENKGVVWNTSDRGIATVNMNGKVTGIAAGEVTITVTTMDGGFTATCTVTVNAPVVPVTNVTLDADAADMEVGGFTVLHPIFEPEDATDKTVLWSSDNMAVATVNDNGTVFAISPGKATITVTTVDGEFTATCNVAVKDPSGPEQVLIEDALGRIYGNANGDTYIDADDIRIIQDIIAGDRRLEDFPLADANLDGKVDSDDIIVVQRYIDDESVTLKVINAVGRPVDVRYPLKGIFTSGGTNMRSMLGILGIEDKLVANATNDYISEVLDQRLYNLRESGKITKCTTAATTADFTNLMFENFSVAIVEYAGTNGYNSDAAIRYFNDRQCDILQLEYDTTEALLTSVATIGILTGAQDRAETFIEYMDGIVDTIRSTLGDKFGTATVMDIVMSNSVSGMSADYYAATLLAGGNNLADFPEVNRTFTAGQDTWLYEDRYNPEYLLHIKSMTYGAAPSKTEISGYVSNFDKTAAYMADSYYLINGTLPYPVRLAYMASVMYPDDFESEWYLDLFQEYVDTFIGKDAWNVRDYKVTWNTQELKAFLN